MSLFLVMKSYSLSLADYLASYRESISPRTSLVLLTQLLEGVAFLTSSGVAHRYLCSLVQCTVGVLTLPRDLKADNLLLCLSGGPEFPQLVITDFGCCLADSRY